MHNELAALPLWWGSIIGVTISESSGISLSLFIAGIVGTVALVWRVRGDRDGICRRLDSLDSKVDKLSRKQAETNVSLQEMKDAK